MPAMKRSTLLLLTAVAMLAFAANSVLCRLALRHTQIDAASFTAVRLVAAALVLWAIVRMRARAAPAGGNWPSALALFAYAAAFSFAYTGLQAGIGALILFGSVQATMVGVGVWRGERLNPYQLTGMGIAIAGLAGLLLPQGTVPAPPPGAAALMMAAGAAWGVYSLRGRVAQDATAATQGNFARTVPMVALLALASLPSLRFDAGGFALAIASGAFASGMGYIVWYTVTPHLKAAHAATVQLSVPLIATAAGALLLGETMSALQLLAGAAILGGIWLSLAKRPAPVVVPPDPAGPRG
jgi:drug/metabolite transporter (DMT)-like permease